MGNTFEFMVTVGTSEDINDDEVAAALLRWAVQGAAYDHEHLNYITVQFSEMNEEEQNRMLDMLDRFDEDEIAKAVEAMDELREKDDNSE